MQVPLYNDMSLLQLLQSQNTIFLIQLFYFIHTAYTQTSDILFLRELNVLLICLSVSIQLIVWVRVDAGDAAFVTCRAHGN